MRIFIVNGPPRAGKDTLILFMKTILDMHKIKHMEYSSIEPVKEGLLRMGVDTRQKTEADRRLLSVVGDALQEHSDYRTRLSGYMFEEFYDTTLNGVFFLHIREPDLIKKIISDPDNKKYQFITVLLDSPRAEKVTSNISDADVYNMEYDFQFNNNGTLGQLLDIAFNLLNKFQILK